MIESKIDVIVHLDPIRIHYYLLIHHDQGQGIVRIVIDHPALFQVDIPTPTLTLRLGYPLLTASTFQDRHTNQ
jgi:hypothetical protein